MEGQPPAEGAAPPPAPAEWASGLLGCCEDIGLCVITYFVPCLTFGQTAEALGDDCMMSGLAMLVPLLNLYCLVTVRGRIREKYGIEGSLVMDLVSVLCCPLCALVQSARQVKMTPGQAVQRV
ncbi:uncharacterized protein LOC134822868 [Bolinopsis microptera]|uniref:uncharacterized protein LOC134822868 n=1 Tax=Bolinopsis microptera TaxID=2820187 RepID=UPI00307950C6